MMKKKILFMSSAKLTAISIGLLLAVFCTIGMSFTPGEEGENVGNPNDTTYVPISGPRKSHYHKDATTGCNATPEVNHGVLDYGEATAVTTGGGTVTISSPSGGGTVTSGNNTTSGSNNGDQVVLKWNCGSTATNANNTSEAAHKRVIRFVATPDANHNFKGWSTDGSQANITTARQASPYEEEMYISDWNQNNGSHESEANALKLKYYAVFAEKVPVTITMAAAEGGNYTYETAGGTPSASGTVSGSNGSVNTLNAITLSVATIDEGYKFYGWYTKNGTNEVFFSTASTVTKAFETNTTVYAKFVPNSQATFTIKGTDQYFYDLGQACAAAASSSSKIVYPIADGTVPAGNYTIPSGVTLLIPYEGTTLNKLTAPALTYYEKPANVPALSCYRKLILLEGANITCNGTICVGGQIASLGGGYPSGYPFGACGVLDMSNGGHIDLNSGANLYAWGFVKGQDMDQGNNTIGVGTITAKSGSKVWEDFTGENRGGSACSALAEDGKSYKSFPFQGYAIQNIEVPVTYQYQSTLQVYTALYIRGNITKDFPLISSSGSLFLVQNSTSQVRKWYDPTTDLACYELSGTAKLDAINTTIYVSVNSADFNLPISSNMHIILDNCTMTLSNPVQILPDAVIEIKANSTATISSNMFMYDKDDWKKGIGAYYFASFKNLTSHKNRGDGTSNATLDDAKLIVDGTLNVTGKLYSTTGGANICGNGGGTITFSSLPTASNIYQCWGAVNGSETYEGVANVRSFSSITGGKTYLHAVAVNSANLHNEDGSYTQSAASSTFHNVNGRWFAAANKDENESTHVYDHFIYISDGQPVSGSSGSTTETKALYAPDKTGLVAGMKWCNVVQDGTCSNIYNATQALNETPASDIRYTYPTDSWLQLLRTETVGVYGGSDNSLYALDGCAVNSLGSVDENCLYTIDEVKKALVDGHFVALEKNTEDEAWHDVANPTNYYICFEGCNWHPATKYPDEEKAYIVEGGNYIWYNGDWKLVERQDPFFFDRNAQNVQVFYEYKNGAWVIATPKVRVQDDIETREFFTFHEAMNVAKNKTNATITILDDVTSKSAALSLTSANTAYTLDLNGHKVSHTITGSGTAAVLNMIDFNAAGTTLTITDNSGTDNGELKLIAAPTTTNQTQRWHGIHVTNGSLIMNAGTLKVEDNFPKNSTTNSGRASGVTIEPGKSFTMNGGTIDVESSYNAIGIHVAGSTSANATVTLNKGTINATTTELNAPRGVYAAGGTTTIKEDITINVTSKTTDARALSIEATSGYFGTVKVKGGTYNVTTAGGNTAIGAYVNGVYTFNNTKPNTIKNTYRAVLEITGGTFNVETTKASSTTAYGVQSRGTVTISNVTFNVTPKSTTGYGLLVQDGTTTVNSGTFNVNATTTARGIYANGATPEDKTGRPYNPNVIVNGGVFNVTATTSTPSHGIYMDCNSSVITSTADGYYAGVYSSVPTVTVNNGEFYVHSTSKEAWGAYVARNYRFETGTNTVAEWYRPTLTINNGTFEVTTGTGANAEAIRSYGTTHVNGGDFTATAKTSAAYGFRVMDGIGTTSNNPKFTVKATTTSAFGAVADVSQPADKTGLPCQGDLTIGGGTFDVDAVTSDAYGLYVNASGRVITSTADGYYPGDYSSIGRATVNSGTFNVTTTTLNAIGAYVKRDVQANRYVSKGELTINDGDFTVATSVQTKGKNCIGVWTYGTTTINGGTFDVTAANSTTAANGYYAFGVYALDGNTVINNSPEFTVKAYANSYGVYANADQANATTGLTSNSNVTINGGTYNVSTTGTTGAIGAIVSVPAVRVIASGDYAGDYYSSATMTINYGTFNVEAATTTATGAYSGRNYVSANTMPNTFSKFNYGNLIIHGGTFNVSTNSETGTTTADGVKSHGTTLIDGGTFNVTPKTMTAFGVRVYAGKTTINETTEHSPEFNVTATTTAYGVMAGGGEAPNSSTGLCYDGEVEVNAGTFNVETTSDKPAYGVYVYVGTRKITSTSSGYYRGNYAYAGIATINGGEFNVTSKKTEAYGIFVPAGATQSGATAYDPASATPECTVNGGKFWITGTSAIYMTNTKALTDNYKIYGGYYGGALNADYGLSKYAVSPKQVITLNDQNANYPKYTYKVGDGATITWKNGSTTLTSTPNLFELEVTPVYYGTEPTKASDAQYTYTFDGWSTTDGGDKLASLPAVSADATYFAHYSKTEKKYTVNVVAGANGSVSPASVSGIGCVTASGDITATPNVGYSFSGWTLPEGVTAADGYTVTSNPIRIHATAAGKTITANFVARTDINYTVKHWQQNIENDEYTEVTADQETKQGTTATLTAATAKTYTGFTALPITQETIAGDGTTVVNIYYDRKTYTIAWVDGDGTTIKTDQNVKYGTTPAYTGSTPTKSTDEQYSYTFSGWSPAITTVSAAATYTATFSSTPRTYAVTLNTNGGTINAGDVTVYTYGTGATLPTNVTKDGHEFGGWFDNSGLTGDAVTSISNTATGNKEYWAKWVSAESGFWLDIVDVDNSTNKLTINTNSWASAGWSYTINDVVYAKNAREADRTLIIPYTGEVGASFSITVKDKLNAVVSKHTYIIPAEIKSDANLADQQMLYVKAGATLTVNADKTVKNIYVAPGAKLVVNSGVTLTADSILLRTTPWASAELELDGTIEGQVCYTRIISKKDQYYQFGLPMPCPIAAVRLSDGSTPTYGGGWLLRSYSEQHRAQNGSGADIDNWVTLTNEGADVNKTIQGRVGYEMFSNSGYYREYYFPVAHTGLSDRVAVTHTTGDAGESHSGWNIVVSPLMRAYAQSPAPEGMTVSWLQQDGSYWQLPVEEIKPAIPFSYQATETGYITFGENIGLSALAPRRVTASEEQVRIQWLQLDVEAADGKTDQTSIYSHPTRYERTYKTGIDVAKQSLTASRAILYSSHVYGDMAFAGVADSLLEAGVALTVYSPSAQELTISMRENDWLNRLAEVWLIDHETGARMNLLDGNYTFDAAEGTTSGRFTIQGVFYAPQVTTDIQNGQAEDAQGAKARKVIIEDKMYILLNGQMFDATGKMVNK